MSIISKELKKPFESSVRTKKNVTEKLSSGKKNLREKASRVAGGSSEVMVKITGFGKGTGHVAAHIKYIARHGKVELETNTGQQINGGKELNAFFTEWNASLSKERKNQRDTMHSIFSMPPGTPPETVKIAVKRLAANTFSNHEYVYALHTDTLHPHVHLTVKLKGFDGKKLNPRKADLQEWRESFAENMRAQGIDAEATPRLVRGVVKKAEKAVVRHIEQGDKTHKPRVSKAKAKAIKEAAEELIQESKGLAVTPGAWVEKIKIAQNKIRETWKTVGESIAKIDDDVKPNTIELKNGKELNNERPDYSESRRGGERIRIARRVAQHLYKSDVDEAQGKRQANTIASLRNLPNIDVVFNRGQSEMLLRKNAQRSLGDQFGVGAGDEVRRSRNGDTSDLKRELNNKELSAKIEKFVVDMPPIRTVRDEIKAKLTKQFNKEKTQDVEAVDKSLEKTKDKDIER
ncbi:relaxase/mobilization nuclease domain-containing protein [Undibacterium sp.]|uniref:relaxase/mobilization nuclease domain-containing protein n=1 Tax=Undibacterium sp. TaxID=1914977 RepID=UPI003750E96D